MFAVFVSSFKCVICFFMCEVNFHVHTQFCVCDFAFLFLKKRSPHSISPIRPVATSLAQNTCRSQALRCGASDCTSSLFLQWQNGDHNSAYIAGLLTLNKPRPAKYLEQVGTH